MARFPVNPRTAQTNAITEALLLNVRRVSQAVYLLPTDGVLLVDAGVTAQGIVIGLPRAHDVPGRAFIVKKIDASAHRVTLAAVANDTIDNAVQLVLETPGRSVVVISDGMSHWWPVSEAEVGTNDHHLLTNLATFDDHPQYFYLPGRLGGQVGIGGVTAGETIFGGSGPGDTLTLTANALTDAGPGGGLARGVVTIEQSGLGQDRIRIGPPGPDPFNAFVPNGVFQFLVVQDAAVTGAVFGAYNTNDDPAQGPVFMGIRARTDLATPTTTMDGDVLLDIVGKGYDIANNPTIFQNPVELQLVQAGAAGSGYCPGKFIVNTTDTTGALGQRLEVDGNGDLDIARNLLLPGGGSRGFIEVGEFNTTNDPSAPAGGKVRVYARDNGAGKVQLMARFPSGTAQQIAIEP